MKSGRQRGTAACEAAVRGRSVALKLAPRVGIPKNQDPEPYDSGDGGEAGGLIAEDAGASGCGARYWRIASAIIDRKL